MGSGELQSWNNPPERDQDKTEQELEEGVPLKDKNSIAQ